MPCNCRDCERAHPCAAPPSGRRDRGIHLSCLHPTPHTPLARSHVAHLRLPILALATWSNGTPTARCPTLPTHKSPIRLARKHCCDNAETLWGRGVAVGRVFSFSTRRRCRCASCLFSFRAKDVVARLGFKASPLREVQSWYKPFGRQRAVPYQAIRLNCSDLALG